MTEPNWTGEGIEPVRIFPTDEEVFGERGLIARAMPGYRPRPAQLQMTGAVDAAYREKGRVLVEGPTGTGKTVAYLVPAIRAAIDECRRTIVVTGNIALQEQIVRKDLPTLKQAISGVDFKFALLKGTSNYLCREQLEDSMLDPSAPFEVRDIASWAQRTETGDVSELTQELAPKVRGMVTVSSEDCLGQKCPQRAACFVMKARVAALQSHIIVVNYHLFFADLSLRMQDARGILPDHDSVVLDELHNAAEIARGFMGQRFSFGSVLHAQRRLLPIRPDLAKDLEQSADSFFSHLAEYRRSDDYRARLRAKEPVPWSLLYDKLRAAAGRLREAAVGEELTKAKRLNGAADTADKQATFLRSAMTLEDEANLVYSIEDEGPRKGSVLVGQPIDVGPLLREHIWESERLATVVGTSATMGDGKNFDLVAREVGAEGYKQVEVPSPFDWPRQAVIAVPPGLPIPKAKGWPEAVCDALLEAIRAADGRTLGLFTSRKMLDEAKRFLLSQRLPYQVLAQGDMPRTRLVEEFRRDVSSVLLGTASLWEGIDVQGEALSCVVIDKLPFGSPDDPVASVLDERRRDYFKRDLLPRAVLEFRQGAGRLIRTTTDRGAIVVLDDRIDSKPYGRKFIRGLPEGVPVHKGSDWAERVREHLAAA